MPNPHINKSWDLLALHAAGQIDLDLNGTAGVDGLTQYVLRSPATPEASLQQQIRQACSLRAESAPEP